MLRILKDLDISSFIPSLRIFWFYSHIVKSFYSGQFHSQLCQQTIFLVSLANIFITLILMVNFVSSIWLMLNKLLK